MSILVKKFSEHLKVDPVLQSNGTMCISTCCPCHHDTRPSLSICFIPDKKSPFFKCFAGCSWKKIYDHYVGIGLLELEGSGEYFQKIIKESRPVSKESVALIYLEKRLNRHVPLESLSKLRVTKLIHQETGKEKDVLIGIVTDTEGKETGVHRTYLENSGKKVADGAKKMLGAIKGSFVSLGLESNSTKVHLAEGLETALAIHLATEERVLAVLSAMNMSEINLWPNIAELHLWGDNDQSKTGQRELLKTYKKFKGRYPFLEVFIHLPERIDAGKGTDWNDVFNLPTGEALIKEQYLKSIPVTEKEAEEILLDVPIIPQFKRIETPTLPIDSLPELLKNFTLDESERLGVPPESILIPALTVCSASLGNKVCIYPKAYDKSYSVTPNTYGLLAGNPSTKKSPAMKVSVSILEELQAKRIESFKEAIRYVKPLIQVAENQKTKILKQIETKGRTEPLLKELYRIEDELIELRKQLKIPKYIINDATPEKVLELSEHSKYGLFIFRDEISGLIKEFDKNGREGFKAMMLEGFHGKGSFSMDRKTVESSSARICFTFFGSTQPDILKSMLKNQNDGFMQRLQLLVFIPEHEVTEGVDRVPNKFFSDSFKAFVVYLFNANEGDLGTKKDNESPYGFNFSDEAYGVLKAYKFNLRQLSYEEDNLMLKGHLDKYDKLICLIALVFHLAEKGTDSNISSATLKSALRIVDFLMKHAEIIYKVLPKQLSNGAITLLRKIKSGEVVNGATVRSIERHGWSGLGKDELFLAIEDLTSLHWLQTEKAVSHTGRPSLIVIFSPLLTKYIHLIT